MKKHYLCMMIISALVFVMASSFLPETVLAADDRGTFYISADGKQLKVKMADTTAARELKSMLDSGDITINMTGNSFEQFGSLGKSLTANDTSITAEPGDVLLYNGNTICIFYGTNSYRYTRLGKVNGMGSDELKKLLSGKDLTITLSKSSFGEVPKTGTENMTARFHLMVICIFIAMASGSIILKKRIYING
ncbi:MAG: hypothetical protein HFI70_05895 [Lachnospiraceae bacterium]|nr:hypothetical protein [Lachnospiraceae bacterium]